MKKKLFERLQELANVEIPKKEIIHKEDELNYYVYELMEDAEIESNSKNLGEKYKGYVKLILSLESYEKKFSRKDILESLTYEEDLYKNYIINEMDLSTIIDGDNITVLNYSVRKEEENIVLKITYESSKDNFRLDI